MFDFFGRKAKKENEQLKAENARLATENAALRPLVEEGRENRELADSFIMHKAEDFSNRLLLYLKQIIESKRKY